MRIDKFLNVVNITKRRAVAEDMCRSGVVSVNGNIVKASKEVKIGDILSIHFTTYTNSYRVVKIPLHKNVPKASQNEYVEKI